MVNYMATKIGIVVAVILVTAIVIYLCIKKEKEKDTFINAPAPPLSYYVTDGATITSSPDIDIGKQLLVGGYGGKIGDMLVSNGPAANPVWTSTDNILKIIGSGTYTIPATGGVTATIPINSDIDTNMSVLIQGSVTIVSGTVSYKLGSVSGSINIPPNSNMFRVQVPPLVGTNLSLVLTITGTGTGTGVLDSVLVSYFKTS